MQAIQDVQDGRDPKGIRRDPAVNPMITLLVFELNMRANRKRGS
ncbi:MAG: hypothetical protein ETSY1_17360 [Candidatus Entotheonella factor]|uniref:Uncharacterized protein n=1 Tax=Entotheonella factor TaxID=1429438 RepID=W4LM91_ENTF1|nr:MAG: hypothetical protein ETSY1_17360 [Candidatus Entotheonella factor]